MSGNLYTRLLQGFPADRERPCFLFAGGRSLSYGWVEHESRRTAAYLKAKGVRPGDRVAIRVEKSAEAVVIYLATLMSGAVFVPINPAYTDDEVQYFLKDAEPLVHITDAEAFVSQAASYAPLVNAVTREGADLASIIYTSGTTGRSKGAMLTHDNLYTNAAVLCDLWRFSSADVLLHALPVFHVHGLFVALHCALLSGCPMVWLARFSESEVLHDLHRATVMMGVPTFYTRLLAGSGLTRDAVANVRLFVSGSAPLLATTFSEFEDRTGHRILERYGMSEAVIITSNPLEAERIPGSVGYPLPGVELRISGGEETGVIEIRGPSVFSGYWRMPEKTRDEFTEDGYFVTGDIGRRDPDGRVYISGRAKDLIISGGYNVYPKEVENILDEISGVSESAVVGLPHHDFGEAVCDFVIGAGEEAALISECRKRLASYKAPKRILFVDALPRNAMGKVKKNLLREAYADLFGDARFRL